jgi:hypothetical protein
MNQYTCTPNLVEARETYYSEKLARILTTFCFLKVACRFSFPIRSRVRLIPARKTRSVLQLFHETERGLYSLLGLEEVKQQPDENAEW